MAAVPTAPKLYHITHVNNLPSILRDGDLWSDAEIRTRAGPVASVGMGSIKQRRLTLPGKCHPGDTVGEYVPFYFCPRSIMLYLIYCANHSELSYRGGQEPILHLELDLNEVIAWANAQPCRWAFSLSNAGARYSEFRNRLKNLDEINWMAVVATDFRDASVKEGKQAEFLVKQFVPWLLVRRVGVHSALRQRQVIRHLADTAHRPPVDVCRAWYF